MTVSELGPRDVRIKDLSHSHATADVNGIKIIGTVFKLSPDVFDANFETFPKPSLQINPNIPASEANMVKGIRVVRQGEKETTEISLGGLTGVLITVDKDPDTDNEPIVSLYGESANQVLAAWEKPLPDQRPQDDLRRQELIQHHEDSLRRRIADFVISAASALPVDKEIKMQIQKAGLVIATADTPIVAPTNTG